MIDRPTRGGGFAPAIPDASELVGTGNRQRKTINPTPNFPGAFTTEDPWDFRYLRLTNRGLMEWSVSARGVYPANPNAAEIELLEDWLLRINQRATIDLGSTETRRLSFFPTGALVAGAQVRVETDVVPFADSDPVQLPATAQAAVIALPSGSYANGTQVNKLLIPLVGVKGILVWTVNVTVGATVTTTLYDALTVPGVGTLYRQILQNALAGGALASATQRVYPGIKETANLSTADVFGLTAALDVSIAGGPATCGVVYVLLQ